MGRGMLRISLTFSNNTQSSCAQTRTLDLKVIELRLYHCTTSGPLHAVTWCSTLFSSYIFVEELVLLNVSERVWNSFHFSGNDSSAQNDWKGAWWHDSFTTHSGNQVLIPCKWLGCSVWLWETDSRNLFRKLIVTMVVGLVQQVITFLCSANLVIPYHRRSSFLSLLLFTAFWK